MLTDQVPQYLSIIFLIAILFPIIMIARLGKQNVANLKSKATFNTIFFFYLTYLVLVGFACFQGIFEAVTLPPKIIVVTTLPLLLFLVGFVFNTNIFKETLKNIPLFRLIQLHVFRLIGSFFIILMLLDKLPKEIGIIAGVGDITTAITSIWVARAVKTRKKNARKLALAWNTFGLLDIIVTSITAIALTKISLETGAQGVEILATFPFCYIPAFAPATIIFLHLSIYRKILFKKYQ